MERIPQELVNAVVDQLIFDRAALVACSLLSHSWRVPALRLLFAAVYINGARSQQKFKAFADFMAESPHLAYYVEEIEMHGKSRTQLELNILVDILTVLPRLRALRLDKIKLWDRKIPTTQTFPLEFLDLYFVCGRSTPKGRCTIVDLLHLFPRLRHLKLDVFLDSFLTKAHNDTRLMPWSGVPEITLYLAGSAELNTWLCSAATKCRTLRVFVQESNLEELGVLNKHNGAELENLEVELASTLSCLDSSGKSYPQRSQHAARNLMPTSQRQPSTSST